MTKDEALRMALEALDFFEDTAICQADIDVATEAITAIKEALANVATEDTSKECVDEMQKQRHEQEPVAWVWVDNKGWLTYSEIPHDMFKSSPLYAHPPQRTWQGLMDKAVTQVIDSMPKNMKGFMVDWDLYEFYKAIEAKLKEKNT